jgi:hypothetical protein
MKYWQKIMYQSHIIHHKSHVTFSVIVQLGKSNGLIYYVLLSAQSLSLKRFVTSGWYVTFLSASVKRKDLHFGI